MPKSTITISDHDDGQIKITINHEPMPTGPRDTWNPTARVADMMAKILLDEGAKHGKYPTAEASMSALTGELHVTTRKKEDELPGNRG